MVWSFVNRLYHRFLRIRGTPREIALGGALGLFIGFTPTMGIQVILAVFFASIFKWSKITAALGVQITNPLTAPFIYSLTYVIGAKLLGLEKPFKPGGDMSLDMLMEMIGQAPAILGAMALGGALIGIPVAALGYIFVYRFMDRYQEPLKAGIKKGARKVSLPKRKKRK